MGLNQEMSAAINGGSVDEDKTYGLKIPLIHNPPSRTLPLDSPFNFFFYFACSKCSGWDLAECGWDLAKWLERLAVNANVTTDLGSNPAPSDTVEFEGRQMKQCWITCIKKKKKKNSPLIFFHWAKPPASVSIGRIRYFLSSGTDFSRVINLNWFVQGVQSEFSLMQKVNSPLYFLYLQRKHLIVTLLKNLNLPALCPYCWINCSTFPNLPFKGSGLKYLGLPPDQGSVIPSGPYIKKLRIRNTSISRTCCKEIWPSFELLFFSCSSCKKEVNSMSLGKYCVR